MQLTQNHIFIFISFSFAFFSNLFYALLFSFLPLDLFFFFFFEFIPFFLLCLRCLCVCFILVHRSFFIEYYLLGSKYKWLPCVFDTDRSALQISPGYHCYNCNHRLHRLIINIYSRKDPILNLKFF